MAGNGVPVLLITANVGSIFEEVGNPREYFVTRECDLLAADFVYPYFEIRDVHMYIKESTTRDTCRAAVPLDPLRESRPRSVAAKFEGSLFYLALRAAFLQLLRLS